LSTTDSNANHRQQLQSTAYGNNIFHRNFGSTGIPQVGRGTHAATTTSSKTIASTRLNNGKVRKRGNNDKKHRRGSFEKSLLANEIAKILDAYETIRFPFKKKLMLNKLRMTAADIPIKALCGTVIGQSLHKLSLSGNLLSTIPGELVACLPNLKSMDISQCGLHQLPQHWDLPQLKRLNLSHNRLTDFPEETMLEGLSELQELNMFGNEVSIIVIPRNANLLSQLETLDLGYNHLAQLPEELDRLKSLKILKVMNNCLEEIPMRVCTMELKAIDVSNNPVLQPPIETCERGLGSMKRYYYCLRREEQSKRYASEALQSKAARKFKKSLLGLGGMVRRQSDDISQSSKSHKSQPSQSKNNRRHSAPDDRSSTALWSNSDHRTSTIHESLPPVVSSKRSQSLHNPSIVNILSPQRINKNECSTSTPSFNNVADTHATLEPTFLSNDDAGNDQVSINETLKVIFVGMAMAGKTSMIRRLIDGEDAKLPEGNVTTIGLNIHEWDPTRTIDKRYKHIDNRILLEDEKLLELCPNANVKFSVWDFGGQHVYHHTHELFFSPRALYVLVWDMGANNPATKQRVRNIKDNTAGEQGTFGLCCDFDDESDIFKEEAQRADKALERDIDEKVQFWVDCIQSNVPGAAILPVATFDDLFEENNHCEAKRRCNILKRRLEEHEKRRIHGIKDRLQDYVDQNRADDAVAMRLQKLLGSRPKIIFGRDEEDSIIKVSGTKYTGFAKLTEKITNIATGRDRATYNYPIFRGHVGARIPRKRLEARDIIRRMREKLMVVEWSYLIQELQKKGIMDVENVSDVLHFLTDIGELLYFGDVLPESKQNNSVVRSERSCADTTLTDEDDGDHFSSRRCRTSATISTTEDNTCSNDGDRTSAGLSQFVFLNPSWLVQAVACILRHDLNKNIQARGMALFHDHQTSNCPVITSEYACMLWQEQKVTREVAKFLQLLLIRFKVFMPIDLAIGKAVLGGEEFSQKSFHVEPQQTSEVITLETKTSSADQNRLQSTYFFLPSLLGAGEPSEGTWTYKNIDAWRTTLCHSVLFPDGVPPGLMERITATVLNHVYAMGHKNETNTAKCWCNAVSNRARNPPSYEGNISVEEVLCWSNAFLLKLKMTEYPSIEKPAISTIEIFTTLVDKDSNVCVGSDQMSVGSRRLVTSGKGPEGDGCRKIWLGGYLMVLEAITEVMEEYGGLEFKKQVFCPECLARKSVSEANCWDAGKVRRPDNDRDPMIRCDDGHNVDRRLLCPEAFLNQNNNKIDNSKAKGNKVLERDILRSVVIVGLWDQKGRRIDKIGSGFIADNKHGLIVTASHTLMNILGEKSTPFGENYFGNRHGKVVIGIIPEGSGTEAVFRYFAEIVAKDPEIEKGTCQLDACVLRITTRMEEDVRGNGEGCGDQIEHILKNNPVALKKEKLKQLSVTDKCEYSEQIWMIGYNQGGEAGRMKTGVDINRYLDCAWGYVSKIFAVVHGDHKDEGRYKPLKEIVIMCPTICGHSGGPCVNQEGKVIGILSRGDPFEKQRCYLVPTGEWIPLLDEVERRFKNRADFKYIE